MKEEEITTATPEALVNEIEQKPEILSTVISILVAEMKENKAEADLYRGILDAKREENKKLESKLLAINAILSL